MVRKGHQVTKSPSHQLEVKVGNLTLKNPVIAASGTFGYGEELKELIDVNSLGAIVTKTITLSPKEGNPTPRIVETPSGMLNSIGIENKGLKDFIFNKAPALEKLKTNVIVSIAGFNLDEFKGLADKLSGLKCVSALELNLSCPNIVHSLSLDVARDRRSMAHSLIAQDKRAVRKIVSTVRKRTKLTVITKLSPNVTDINEIAKAAEDGGSDAISLINTIFGMSVNINTGKSNLAREFGGLSGPAVKPVALYCVRQAYKAVKIPIIGIGGIMTAEDAIEFMICGAKAVQIGTANFVNPKVATEVISGIMGYLRENKINSVSNLIGNLKVG